MKEIKIIVAAAIGAALYGVLSVYGGGIPVYGNVQLRYCLIVVIVVAGYYGPLAGALAGGIGNVIADAIGGWGFWWSWSIANAIAGAILGATGLFGANLAKGKFTQKHLITFAILAILAHVIAYGLVAPLLDQVMYGGDLTVNLTQGWVAAIGNIIVSLVIGLPVQWFLAGRNATAGTLAEE